MVVKSFVEKELKFDVEAGFVVPALDSVLPPGGRIETRSEQLRSDYFDTADHALLRARMTLRRRTGSTDTGWQLKVPHHQFREEIHAGASDESVGANVPAELTRLLLGVSGGQPLARIASVVTQRSVTELLDADGAHLAEIDDDNVHASAGGDAGAVLTTWREVEVELGNDEVELLYALGKRLRKAGARRSSSSSKLSRALPSTSPAAAPVGAKPGRRGPRAADVVGAYVAEQQRVLLAGDLALRRGEESVIHPTRVATRRLRSTLRVFAPLLQADRAAALDSELRWYAAELGQVRDRQVLRKRLDSMIAAVDDSLLLGPVKARVDTELNREQAEHWQQLQDDLNTDRYLAMLAEVAGWVREAPTTPLADRPAATIATLVKRADRKVYATLRRANATGDIHLLHAARKAAKRARYAAEAAQPVIGRAAADREAKRYQKLQDLLGEHQDSLVSADLLRRLGAVAGTTDGENGFAFGILHEREENHARIARRKARKTAKRYAF